MSNLVICSQAAGVIPREHDSAKTLTEAGLPFVAATFHRMLGTDLGSGQNFCILLMINM